MGYLNSYLHSKLCPNCFRKMLRPTEPKKGDEKFAYAKCDHCGWTGRIKAAVEAPDY